MLNTLQIPAAGMIKAAGQAAGAAARVVNAATPEAAVVESGNRAYRAAMVQDGDTRPGTPRLTGASRNSGSGNKSLIGGTEHEQGLVPAIIEMKIAAAAYKANATAFRSLNQTLGSLLDTMK